MRYLSRCFVLTAAVLSFAFIMPSLYSMVLRKNAEYRHYSYSIVIRDFVYSTRDKALNRAFRDNAGNEYDEREFARILPFVYTGALVSWGEYPDFIDGEFISAETAQQMWDWVPVSAVSSDAVKIRIQLYPMYNAESSEIETPPELFRIGSRMEFLDSRTNRINEEMSALFTDALTGQGFMFPATQISGNPTTRKPYDFGYFVIDSAEEVFHVYNANGQPVANKTGIKPAGGIFRIIVKEDHMPYYGLLISRNGDIYLISKEDYALNHIPAGEYDPAFNDMRYSADPLTYTIQISGGGTTSYYAVNKNLEPVKSFSYTPERSLRGAARVVYDTLFPFILRSNPKKYDFNLQIVASENLRNAIILSVFLALGYAVFLRGRVRGHATDIVFILISGIYGLLAVIMLGREKG